VPIGRVRVPLLVKLVGALVVPAVAVFAVFAYVAYEVSRRDLDAELGRRLEAIAATAATQIHGKYLVELAPGNKDDVMYKNVAQKLDAVARATDAHLVVFDREFVARADTDGDLAIGAPYFRAELDRVELERVFAGATAASVLFDGEDGVSYKTGYAPVRATETDPTIVLALGARAPASYFDRLDDLRGRLFAWGAGLALVGLAAATLAAMLVTRHVRRLAAAAERIGAGDLSAPVVVKSHDELGVLAGTMDRMREQLAERDAKLQQMLAGIAHEVRNPLAGMTLFAGILRDELDAGDARRGHVDKIQRELGYLERVVDDFLAYARRPKPELADVPLGDLLDEIAQLGSTPDIAIAAAPTDAIARADRGQLRRALLNLARNAVQAASAAGHAGGDVVALSARRDGDAVVIAVWNRGKEISAETSGKLFEPFFTTREKGTGLGLAFVRDIALDHGGRVEVASADGETTFTLVIPAAGDA
jgi:signal transduction histidine kinase